MTAPWIADLWQVVKPAAVKKADTLVCLVAEMRDAASAEQRDRARDRAADLAHQLAGSLGSYGFPEGSRLAVELEVQVVGRGGGEPGITAACLRQCITEMPRDA